MCDGGARGLRNESPLDLADQQVEVKMKLKTDNWNEVLRNMKKTIVAHRGLNVMGCRIILA